MKAEGKKSITFRQEIRQSLLKNTLVPTLIIAVVFLVAMMVIWVYSIQQAIERDNFEASNLVNKTLSAYSEKIVKPLKYSMEDVRGSESARKEILYDFSSFISRQSLNATFVLMDETMDIIVEAENGGAFNLKESEKVEMWGAIGRARSNPNSTIVEISNEYSADKEMQIVMVKMVIEDGLETGCMLFLIDENAIKHALSPTFSHLVITNKFGRALTSTNYGYINTVGKMKEEYFFSEDGTRIIDNFIVVKGSISSCDLSVFSMSNISMIFTGILSSIALIIIVAVFMIYGTIKSSEKFSSEKSKTIEEIVKAYEAVERGDLGNRLYIESNEEFEIIADAYNKMLDDIKGLIVANNKRTLEKYISELKQLEMQFNPHFLFNTLETIKYLVKLDPDKAQESIVNLAEIFRHSIDNSVSEVSLEDDMVYIKNYLEIIKARFNKKFSYEIEISKSAYLGIIPKLIIQPIIENAVKYGFGNKKTLDVKIEAKVVSSDLTIRIVDDGNGIDSVMLKEINKNLSENDNNTNHIGLYNVNKRIKLLYGEEYGLKVKSKEGFGTTVLLSLPYKVENKND